MRILKFRAWDKRNKKMVMPIAVYDTGDHIGFSEETYKKCYGPDFEPDFGNEPESHDGDWFYLLGGIEIMQFTGLKDKNGREIYEGDILNRKLFASGNPNGSEYKTVSWLSTTQYTGWNVARDTTWEVIGNIHEHSELLKP